MRIFLWVHFLNGFNPPFFAGVGASFCVAGSNVRVRHILACCLPLREQRSQLANNCVQLFQALVDDGHFFIRSNVKCFNFLSKFPLILPVQSCFFECFQKLSLKSVQPLHACFGFKQFWSRFF